MNCRPQNSIPASTPYNSTYQPVPFPLPAYSSPVPNRVTPSVPVYSTSSTTSFSPSPLPTPYALPSNSPAFIPSSSSIPTNLSTNATFSQTSTQHASAPPLSPSIPHRLSANLSEMDQMSNGE